MTSKATFLFRGKRDLGEVISGAFELISQNARDMARTLLRVCTPALVGFALGGGMIATGVWRSTAADGDDIGGLAVVGLLLVLFSSMALGLLLVLATNSYVALYREHGPGMFDAADVWQRCRAMFWRFVGVNLLLGFAYVLLNVVLIVPCLGLLAFMAGSAYLMTTFSLSYPVIAHEDAGVFEAVSRCRTLVEGHWWMTFGVVALTYLLYYLLVMGAFLPLFSVLFAFAFHGMEPASSGLGGGMLAVTILIGVAGAFLLQVLPHVAVIIQYFNLVERKEYSSLAARVVQVGNAGPKPWWEREHLEGGEAGAQPTTDMRAMREEEGRADGAEDDDTARWRPPGGGRDE